MIDFILEEAWDNKKILRLPNESYFTQYQYEGYWCREHHCRWKLQHCRDHGTKGDIIIQAYRDSIDILKSYENPIQDLIVLNNTRVKDAFKIFEQLVKDTVDPQNLWGRCAAQNNPGALGQP